MFEYKLHVIAETSIKLDNVIIINHKMYSSLSNVCTYIFVGGFRTSSKIDLPILWINERICVCEHIQQDLCQWKRVYPFMRYTCILLRQYSDFTLNGIENTNWILSYFFYVSVYWYQQNDDAHHIGFNALSLSSGQGDW